MEGERDRDRDRAGVAPAEGCRDHHAEHLGRRAPSRPVRTPQRSLGCLGGGRSVRSALSRLTKAEAVRARRPCERTSFAPATWPGSWSERRTSARITCARCGLPDWPSTAATEDGALLADRTGPHSALPRARSPLVGFGIDSVIEAIAGGVIVWLFTGGRGSSPGSASPPSPHRRCLCSHTRSATSAES